MAKLVSNRLLKLKAFGASLRGIGPSWGPFQNQKKSSINVNLRSVGKNKDEVK